MASMVRHWSKETLTDGQNCLIFITVHKYLILNLRYADIVHAIHQGNSQEGNQ